MQTRTVEIFDSFGVGEEMLREAFHVMEIAFWKWSEEKGGIQRSHYAPDKEAWISHRPHVILNQARLNALMLSQLADLGVVHYNSVVKSVEVDDDAVKRGDDHCVRVQAVQGEEKQTWYARYVLVREKPSPHLCRSSGTLTWTNRNRAATAPIARYGGHWDTRWSATAPTLSGA